MSRIRDEWLEVRRVGHGDKACRTRLLTSEDKIIFRGAGVQNSLFASVSPSCHPSFLFLNMDNDCLHLQNHKSEVPTATEQLARLPIIIIINHADFTVFSGTAGGCTGRVWLAPPGPQSMLGRTG